MLWLTWRQHRVELAAAAVLLGIIAVPLVANGMTMHEAYQSDGIAGCVADPTSRGACAQIVDHFVNGYAEWGRRLIWVALLPALAGVFVGAPLLAREFEHGTWKLAFTQSVTRTRWLATNLAVVGAGVAVIAVAFATLFSWWRAPLDVIDGRMRTTAFIVAGPSLGAVTLFAFAVGVLAGALLRRTIVAMGATLVVFFAVRIPWEEYIRPHYLAPQFRITEPVVKPDPGWRPTTDWVVNSGWIDSSGRRLSDTEEWNIVREVYGGNDAVQGPGSPVERYMADHGLRHYTEYHPDSAFWSFQVIEAGLFLGFAAILIMAAIWIVRRRTM